MFIKSIATTTTSTILLTLGGRQRKPTMKLFGISLFMLTFVIAGCGRTSTSNRSDQAYLNLQYSSTVILSNLTPELNGLSETDAQRKANIAVVNNQNMRMAKDDINRFLLLDKPSMLSEYPVSGD